MTDKIVYIECDVPPGMTLEQYRRRGRPATLRRPRRRWRRRRYAANSARVASSASTSTSTSAATL